MQDCRKIYFPGGMWKKTNGTSGLENGYLRGEHLDSSTYVLYSREEPILAGGATAEILPLSSDPDNTGVEKQSQITV